MTEGWVNDLWKSHKLMERATDYLKKREGSTDEFDYTAYYVVSGGVGK